MSFREWLPITTRNRVALAFAFAGLVMFVVWNYLPRYDWGTSSAPIGIVATTFWPDIISPGHYVMVFKRPDFDGFVSVAASMALIQNAFVTLAMIPFWKILHASAYVRVPLAVVNLLGGAVIVWLLKYFYFFEAPPYWITAVTLMAAGRESLPRERRRAMSFREWLPITTRNRVALFLAFAGLVMFVVWNCLPYYESADTPSGKIAALVAWPEFFDPDIYLDVIRSPDMDGLLSATASMGVIFGGLIVLIAVPLWQILHASHYIRLPIALMNLLGGTVIAWLLFDNVLSAQAPYWIATIVLIGLSLFSVSAAFFLFKNELALREERGRPQAG